ncbi:MAG: cytochrome C [Candidatus Cloacimonadota bacterium]|nr:MAG: cytochrome C [Candidatus Cloacimonadota bacterium]PIE77984.1 MAG: cytochrome C [Candidatus Delongbacteria bacterium]
MKKTISLILIGVIIGVVVSLISAEMVEHTSGVEFCSSCHSMEGMTEAYKLDVHGGYNKNGTKAKCSDCHLPHNNVVNYLFAKGYTGVKDVIGEIFYADGIDWIPRLENRADYTYSSGCKKCHDLKAMREDIPKAYLAHKEYEMGRVKSCVECHRHVGHKNMIDHLKKRDS